MDAKDLRTESALSERNNDGSKYSHNEGVALQCDRNKTYQEIGSNSLGKVDVPSSRPCAVIGPDRVVPPPAPNEAYYKKIPSEPWPCMDNTLHTRRPPEYPHKLTNYQNPSRNISPRQTFQENMQRIMMPPSYNSVKINEDNNYAQLSERSSALSKNIKLNVPSEAKYCDVPYNVYPPNNEQQKNIRNSDMCLSSANPNLARTVPHGWPAGSVNVRPTRAYGAPELYQYQEYPSCAGPRPLVPRSNRTVPEEPGYLYAEPFYHQEGNIRFKPYPTVKERFPQQRYEYIGNYPNTFHPPPPFPTHKYELQKSVPTHPYQSYPQIKYRDRPEPLVDGFQRNQQGNYNIPYHNQIIPPNYPSGISNNPQNKIHLYPPDGHVKSVTPNKLPYDAKAYIEYENGRPKMYSPPENYLVNQMGRMQPMKSQIMMPNYATLNMHNMPPNPYYKKDNQQKNYEYMQAHYRSIDPNLHIHNPMIRHQPVFSPNTLAISPTDSIASNDTSHTLGTLQEDCGYVSQSSSASVRSIDSGMHRIPNDYLRRYYDSRYGPIMRTTSMMSKSELNSSNNSKEKKNIDVRQFLSMWNEGDEGSEENSSKDTIIVQSGPKSDNNFGKGQVNGQQNQEQLYVLGLVNVPSEELGKYEHIQKISKLPENIKGYSHIELLNQFEEAIESSDMTNYKSPKEYQMQSKVAHSKQINGLMPPRPLSPLDVEAKISQSVIHKEVGCNFEIKPCSPKMLNVEVATPVQNILAERAIEKVTNPVMLRSPRLVGIEEKMDCNIMQRKDHRLSSEPARIPSCKMVNPQFSNNSSIDSIKNSYSLQDLESNSGLCLASLPRLDNDIELNFPEVNQQFINANKGDASVLTNSLEKDLPTLDILDHSDSLTKTKVNGMNTFTQESDIIKSPCFVDSEKEPSKLSKYRKTKLDPKENLNAVRTDSVIIKNPENAKNFEENSIFSPTCFNNNQLNDIQKAPINLTQNTNSSEKEIKSPININPYNISKDKDTSIENAIDFSLNKTIVNDKIESIMTNYYQETEKIETHHSIIDDCLIKLPRFSNYNLNTQSKSINSNNTEDEHVSRSPKTALETNENNKENTRLKDECMSPTLSDQDINDKEECMSAAACIEKINDVRSNSLLPIEFVTTTAELSPIADSNSSNDMMDIEVKSNGTIEHDFEKSNRSFIKSDTKDINLNQAIPEDYVDLKYSSHHETYNGDSTEVSKVKNAMESELDASVIRDPQLIKSNPCKLENDEILLATSNCYKPNDDKDLTHSINKSKNMQQKTDSNINMPSPINIVIDSNMNCKNKIMPSRDNYWSDTTENEKNSYFELSLPNKNTAHAPGDIESENTEDQTAIQSDLSSTNEKETHMLNDYQAEIAQLEAESHLDSSSNNKQIRNQQLDVEQIYNLPSFNTKVNHCHDSITQIQNDKTRTKPILDSLLKKENDNIYKRLAFSSCGGKEMHSPWMQKLVLFSEGSTNNSGKKCNVEVITNRPLGDTSVEPIDITYDFDNCLNEDYNEMPNFESSIKETENTIVSTVIDGNYKINVNDTSSECKIIDSEDDTIFDKQCILPKDDENTECMNQTGSSVKYDIYNHCDTHSSFEDHITCYTSSKAEVSCNTEVFEQLYSNDEMKYEPKQSKYNYDISEKSKIVPNCNIGILNEQERKYSTSEDPMQLDRQSFSNDKLSDHLIAQDDCIPRPSYKTRNCSDDLPDPFIDNLSSCNDMLHDKSLTQNICIDEISEQSDKQSYCTDYVANKLNKPIDCCDKPRTPSSTQYNFNDKISEQLEKQSQCIVDVPVDRISDCNTKMCDQLNTQNNSSKEIPKKSDEQSNCSENGLKKSDRLFDCRDKIQNQSGIQYSCYDEIPEKSDCNDKIQDLVIPEHSDRHSYCSDYVPRQLDRLSDCNNKQPNELCTQYSFDDKISEQFDKKATYDKSEKMTRPFGCYDKTRNQLDTQYSCNGEISEQSDKESHCSDDEHEQLDRLSDNNDKTPVQNSQFDCYDKTRNQLDTQSDKESHSCNDEISEQSDKESPCSHDEHEQLDRLTDINDITPVKLHSQYVCKDEVSDQSDKKSYCSIDLPKGLSVLSDVNDTMPDLLHTQFNCNDDISEKLDKTSNCSDDVQNQFVDNEAQNRLESKYCHNKLPEQTLYKCSKDISFQLERLSALNDKIPNQMDAQCGSNNEIPEQYTCSLQVPEPLDNLSTSNCSGNLSDERHLNSNYNENIQEEVRSLSSVNNNVTVQLDGLPFTYCNNNFSNESHCQSDYSDKVHQLDIQSERIDIIPSQLNSQSIDERMEDLDTQYKSSVEISKELDKQSQNDIIDKQDVQLKSNNAGSERPESQSDRKEIPDEPEVQFNRNESTFDSDDEKNECDKQSRFKTKVDSPTIVQNDESSCFKLQGSKSNQFNKNRQSLKRSLSDSALNEYNSNELSHQENVQFIWPLKRRKANDDDDLITQNLCNIIHNNNRRNSISSFYNEENVSFCILIDNSCIIEEEGSDEQEKICYTELSEECLAEIQKHCPKEHEADDIVENVTPSPSPHQEHDIEYSDSYVMHGECEHFEESWVEDVACVETIDDIAEDIEISGASSLDDEILTDNDESGVFSSSEHTDKVKYIYGEKMCNDDAQFVETLYNTPQMNVNKTLGQREPLVLGEYYDNDSLEKVLSESNDQELLPYVPECTEPIFSPEIIDIKETVANKENVDIVSALPVQGKQNSIDVVVEAGINKRGEENVKLGPLFHETRNDTLDSCEPNINDVFSYKENDNNDYTSSSSPEVSSTTSEERNSGILLKITNYKGSRISQINNSRDIKRPRCKFTEEKGYVPTHRPLLTKAAQKYIPPLKETMRDLKVKLSLPPHSLMKLKQLKKSKDEPKLSKRNTTTVPNISKKPKPKFEDVLKSIDEIQFKKHKEKSKKTKKSIPKVVIKKTENGSHYTSTSSKDEFNPDLTGRKWQPWVFIEKNHFIDKMAIKKKTKAVYSHRKRTFVLAEKFQKYKSVSSAKFVISPPISDHPSTGLKYTIRLKHTY